MSNEEFSNILTDTAPALKFSKELADETSRVNSMTGLDELGEHKEKEVEIPVDKGTKRPVKGTKSRLKRAQERWQKTKQAVYKEKRAQQKLNTLLQRKAGNRSRR